MRHKIFIIIERIVLRFFYYLKINLLFEKARIKQGVRILAYHEIGRLNFEEHIKYLIRNNYNVISMDQFVQSYSVRTRMPDKSVIITFDDGWKSNYSEVFPVVKEYQVPILIYIVSNTYARSQPPWFFRLAALKSAAIRDLPCEEDLMLLCDEDRKKQLSEIEKKNEKKTLPSQIISLDELREMASSGFVKFGSHSLSHANLNKISYKEAQDEICISKVELESLLGDTVEHFAYPTGFFDKHCLPLLQKSGYKTAVTIIPGLNRNLSVSDFFELKRIFLSARDDRYLFAAKLSGLWYKLHKNKYY